MLLDFETTKGKGGEQNGENQEVFERGGRCDHDRVWSPRSLDCCGPHRGSNVGKDWSDQYVYRRIRQPYHVHLVRRWKRGTQVRQCAACPVLQGTVMTGNMMDFIRSEKGVTVIEYAVIVMLIALGLVSTLTAISGVLRGVYQSVADAFH